MKLPPISTRMLSLLLESDMSAQRFGLALVAALWSIALALPGSTFDRQVYTHMREFGSEAEWALAWGIYAIAAMIRVFSAGRHIVTDFLINIAGMTLYCTSFSALYVSSQFPPPASLASDFGLSILSIWILLRTHFNSPDGWRDG